MRRYSIEDTEYIEDLSVPPHRGLNIVELCDVTDFSANELDVITQLETGQSVTFDAIKVTREPDTCFRSSCRNPSAPVHTCPFKADIHDDEKTLCDCCDSCKHECAMDI